MTPDEAGPVDTAGAVNPSDDDLADHLARIPAVRAAVLASMTVDDVHAVMERVGHCCECMYRREQDLAWERGQAMRATEVSTLPGYGKRWLQADLDVLRELWLTDEECARILGRTIGAVQSARDVYKIYPGRPIEKPERHPDRQRVLRKYAEELAARPRAVR